MNKDFVSLRQLKNSKRIWWIRSYPTLKRWIEKDISGSNILKTVKVGSGKSTRYFFLKENVEKYVRAFEQGTP